jgi:hypothetical protein
MIWNKKRILNMQVYKEKGKNDFLVVFFNNQGYNPECFCGFIENPEPSNNCFCHSTCSYDFLSENCYPISEKKLKKYPEWYQFLNNYITD